MRRKPSFHWQLARIVFYPLFRWIFGMKVEGFENLPTDKPFIVAPNHRTYWDPPAVGVALFPFEPYFLAKEELWTETPWLGAAISFLNGISISRRSGGKEAIKMALKILQEGNHPMVIFPEGTRNRDPKRTLLPLKAGTAMLAIKMRLPIVPTWIKGVRKNWYRWILRNAELKVKFGRPIDPSDYPDNRNGWRELTKVLESELLKMAED